MKRISSTIFVLAFIACSAQINTENNEIISDWESGSLYLYDKSSSANSFQDRTKENISFSFKKAFEEYPKESLLASPMQTMNLFMSAINQDQLNSLYESNSAPEINKNYLSGRNEDDQLDLVASIDVKINNKEYLLYKTADNYIFEPNKKSSIHVLLKSNDKYYLSNIMSPKLQEYIELLKIAKPAFDENGFNSNAVYPEKAIQNFQFFDYSTIDYEVITSNSNIVRSADEYALYRSLISSSFSQDKVSEYVVMNEEMENIKPEYSMLGMSSEFHAKLFKDLQLIPTYKIKYKSEGSEIMIIQFEIHHKNVFQRTSAYYLEKKGNVWKRHFNGPRVSPKYILQTIKREYAIKLFNINANTIDADILNNSKSRNNEGINSDNFMEYISPNKDLFLNYFVEKGKFFWYKKIN